MSRGHVRTRPLTPIPSDHCALGVVLQGVWCMPSIARYAFRLCTPRHISGKWSLVGGRCEYSPASWISGLDTPGFGPSRWPAALWLRMLREHGADRGHCSSEPQQLFDALCRALFVIHGHVPYSAHLNMLSAFSVGYTMTTACANCGDRQAAPERHALGLDVSADLTRPVPARRGTDLLWRRDPSFTSDALAAAIANEVAAARSPCCHHPCLHHSLLLIGTPPPALVLRFSPVHDHSLISRQAAWSLVSPTITLGKVLESEPARHAHYRVRAIAM